MRLRVLTIITATLALLFSCSTRVETGYEAIGLVNRIVVDSLDLLRERASFSGKPSGTIVLIGEPMRCVSMSEKFMEVDEFDNVDARVLQDGLPDFAGETIVSLLDFSLAPYDSVFSVGTDTLFFREAAIRNAVAAIDTSIGCKMLVICSPLLSERGGEDIEDLFGRIDCDVPVVYSSDTAFSFTAACYKVMRDRNAFTHDIAYPKARLMAIPEGGGDLYPASRLYDDNLVPDQFADTVGVFAPKTYISHVQNKHNTGRD